MKEFFKDWAIPGPRVSSQLPDAPDGETLDALSGHYKIFQLKDGHRFSTDDLLTAWYGTQGCPSATRVLDLGSGIGSVGMIAAWRLQGAKFVTVEAQEKSVELARKSAHYNGLDGRYEIRCGDFRKSENFRDGEVFDLVLGSPPYFPVGSGLQSDHPQKDACRFELRGDVRDYCDVAAARLALGGVFACVFPMQQKSRVFEGSKRSGMTVIKFRPVVLREGEEPLLGVFLMMKSDHLPAKFREQTFEEKPLLIRKSDGSVDSEYSLVKLSIGFPP